MSFLIGLFLLVLAIVSVSLQRTYHRIPAKELKRRIRGGDKVAAGLHRAAAYGYSLNAVLWMLVAIFNSLFFVFVSRTTDTWFAVFVSAVVIWFSFIWLPPRDVSDMTARVAAKIAPVFAWVLQYIHPIISRVYQFLRRRGPVHIHTGVYEKEDLVELLETQKQQKYNRIPDDVLETAIRALSYGDKIVRDILTPRRVVRSISVEETVGPILMSELHDSGFSRFPVYEGKKDHIVGILYLRDLVSVKNGGKIKNLMSKKVCYMHEEQDLRAGLQAILTTHQQLFIVVNSFEEYVGVVSIEDILEEILGKQIVDEFDQFDDMRAVAASVAKREHEERIEKKEEHPADLPLDDPGVDPEVSHQ